MLKVNGSLYKANFDKPIIGICLSSDKIRVGYVLKFGDFSLYVSDYIAQVLNVFGITSVDGTITSKRKIHDKGYIVNENTIANILSDVDNNTILLSSLSLYFNEKVHEFIEIDYNEWGSLSRSRKLFITYLLGSIHDISYLITLFSYCSIEEKSELFYLLLSLIGIYKLTILLTNPPNDLAQTFMDIEKTKILTSSVTIEQALENNDKNGQVILKKSEKLTVVERTFGKFHKSANIEFYKNLVEVHGIAPTYRGRVSWKNILSILRDNPKYSTITLKYINDSGYKLNENNLRNWYNYYINNSLKSDKFKILSDISEIEEFISDTNYNTKE